MEALKKIGLTDGEIRVYLALLELGSSTSWDITQKAKVSGSKVYEVLNRLEEKGLVNEMIKNNVKYFEATNPERILDYLEDKNKEIEKEKLEIRKIIPELLLKKSVSKKAEVKIYTGFEGAKNVWEEVITMKKGEEVVGWGLTDQPASWESYFNEREKVRDKKGIVHRHIINARYKSLYSARKGLPNTFFRFFSEDLEMLTDVQIWRNKVAFFITPNVNPITMVIENQENADSFRKSFEILWKNAKR